MTRICLAFVIALLAACAPLRNDKTVCPEFRKIRCATDVECSWDAAKQCRTCRCAPAKEGVHVDPPGMPMPTH